MTLTLQRPVEGHRFAQTRHNDSMQLIAARELGDASRWAELVAFNDLVPPFITNDPSEQAPGVLLAGQLVRIPAAVVTVSAGVDADRVFERDVALVSGQLGASDGGDLLVAAGLDNLRQAVRHRLETERGDLIFHPQYGSLLRRIIGSVNGPTAGLLAAGYAKAAVLSDPRISSVLSSEASVVGDVINVTVVAEPIVGRRVELNLVI